jgi:hypothetical protein
MQLAQVANKCTNKVTNSTLIKFERNNYVALHRCVFCDCDYCCCIWFWRYCRWRHRNCKNIIFCVSGYHHCVLFNGQKTLNLATELCVQKLMLRSAHGYWLAGHADD